MTVRSQPETRLKKKNFRPNGIGLQVKSAVILTCVVVGVVSASAWSYYRIISRTMRRNNHQKALVLGKALSWAAEAAQREGREEALRNLVKDWAGGKGTAYVAVFDKEGRVTSAQGG